MITLNAIDKGTDEQTLGQIVKSVPQEELPAFAKALGFEVEYIDELPEGDDLTELTKSELCDLIKSDANGRKVKYGGTKKTKSGKVVQKVVKRILVHMKNGKTYFRNQKVNADVAEDARVAKNILREFDERVSMDRKKKNEHITEYAKDMNEMLSTPEGRAAADAINKAIGKNSEHGKLTKNLHYTDIRYCTDPYMGKNADGEDVYRACVAIAKNPVTGKDQYFYSEPFRKQAVKEKKERAITLCNPEIEIFINECIHGGEFPNQDIADCIDLMYNYGMKRGNLETDGKNQLGKTKTSGAATLRAENVFEGKDGKVYIQYWQTGERGGQDHQMSQEIKDPDLAARLLEKKKNADSPESYLFDCTPDQLLSACQSTLEINCEDLRTAYAYRMFLEGSEAVLGTDRSQVKTKQRVAKDKAGLGIKDANGKPVMKEMTRKGAEMEIADYMMNRLGVTDKRSVNNFMNMKLLDTHFAGQDLTDKANKAKKQLKEAQSASRAASREADKAIREEKKARAAAKKHPEDKKLAAAAKKAATAAQKAQQKAEKKQQALERAKGTHEKAASALKQHRATMNDIDEIA